MRSKCAEVDKLLINEVLAISFYRLGQNAAIELRLNGLGAIEISFIRVNQALAKANTRNIFCLLQL